MDDSRVNGLDSAFYQDGGGGGCQVRTKVSDPGSIHTHRTPQILERISQSFQTVLQYIQPGIVYRILGANQWLPARTPID
jgi:hypothetical protein